MDASDTELTRGVPGGVRPSVLRFALLVFALLGAAAMGYLLYLHYAPVESAVCNIGETFSCITVNKSIYATIFGIPTALLGLLYFLYAGVVAAWFLTPLALRALALVSILALGPSLHLTLTSVFVLGTVCVFCEGSKVLMGAIAFLAGREAFPLSPSKRHILLAIAGAIVLGILTYLLHEYLEPSLDAVLSRPAY